MRVLCLGFSYTGRALSWLAPVYFLSRTPERVRSAGYRTFPEKEPGPPIDMILDCVPATGQDLPYQSTVKRILLEFPHTRYVHISSTSVLPNGASEDSAATPVFDETTAPAPDEKRGGARLKLERDVVERYGSRASILRSGGIYGPGRSLIERFARADFSRSTTGNRIVSRIHVADLARLALKLGEARESLPLVHGVDLRPSPNREVFVYLEQRLGIQIPGTWREDPLTGRRIVSLTAARLLGRYMYPDYRSGFEDCLRRSACFRDAISLAGKSKSRGS